MKIKSPVLFALVALSAAVGCATKDANTPNSNTADNTSKPTANANASADAAPKFNLKPGEIPFPGFPTVGTTAKAGDVVLCPSYTWIQDAVTKGPDKVTFIFYDQKMVTPGEVESELEFMSPGKAKVPNSYIIPIPGGQKAKPGDIVLTWWQSGSGMNRAIVVEASDPSEPTVRYLDIDYDNPAKSRDGKTTIGQMEEKLKPNSFVKISNVWEPGSVVAANDGASRKRGQIIRVAGDKVLTLGFAGTLQAYDKSACTPVPVVPKVKAGDKVKAPRYGAFTDATVTKVDGRIGRVFVKFGTDTEEKAIPFGDVLTN
jgi:hypothetical protein